MYGKSTAPPAQPTTPKEHLADAVEAELDRLRAARPHLDSRIDRASQILLLQLASPPRQRPIRCRLGADGRHRRALVRSSSGDGGVYIVRDVAGDFACSCPDHHRHGAGCKHALAVYVLGRVAAQVHHARPRSELGQGPSAEGPTGCHACNAGWVHLGEDVIDSQTGEAAHATNVVPCRRCRPTPPPYMGPEEMEAWMAGTRWRFAKTQPQHPHSYSLSEWNDPETFLRVVRTVWDQGYDRLYLRRPWRSLDVGTDYIWVCTRPTSPRQEAPLETTELVNRASRTQDRLV